MADKSEPPLSRRERQIMDIIFARGEASAAQIHQDLPDRPSYSAVRALLRIMEDKGLVKHKSAGGKYIYMPTTPPKQAARSAIRRLVNTFFNGSAEQAMAALLESADTRPDQQELKRLAALIDKARKEGR